MEHLLETLTRRHFNSLLAATCAYCAAPAIPLSAAAAPAVPDGKFAHPGMLHSPPDLQRMRDAVAHRKEPTFAGFEVLRKHPLSQASYIGAGTHAEIGRNPTIGAGDFDRDSNAAYQCALMSAITRDLSFAKVAIGLLNAWASTLKQIGGADAVLCATLGGFKLVNAAELVRYTDAGWPVEDAERFGKLLRDVFLPVIDNFAPYANGNWDTAALKMMIASAIYLEDHALFDRALVYYRFGCGDGRISHYIYANGQCQESGRDQQHTQLGLAHMGDCCEMAWHQGLDLYSTLDNRLLLGFEYTARYELGEDVPFMPDLDKTGKYRHTVISPRSPLRPVFEQIYNHYVRRRGLAAPWTQRAAEKLRPEGAAFGADHTGFGTLLYSRATGADKTQVAAGAVPSGLHAGSTDAGIVLSVVPLASGAAATILRSQEGDSTVTVIARDAESTHIDRSAKPGMLYTYRVGSSLPATQRMGLPEFWQRHDPAHLGPANPASFDGAAYHLQAAGTTTPIDHGGACLMLHRAMTAGSTFTARLVPLIASQVVELGLGVLDSSAASLQLALLVSPRAQSERPTWSATVLQAQPNAAPMKVVNTQALAAPVVTWGRIVAPLWLRLSHTASTIHASLSNDGATWTELAEASLAGEGMRVGMFLNSGMADLTTEVCFDNVGLTP